MRLLPWFPCLLRKQNELPGFKKAQEEQVFWSAHHCGQQLIHSLIHSAIPEPNFPSGSLLGTEIPRSRYNSDTETFPRSVWEIGSDLVATNGGGPILKYLNYDKVHLH